MYVSSVPGGVVRHPDDVGAVPPAMLSSGRVRRGPVLQAIDSVYDCWYTRFLSVWIRV